MYTVEKINSMSRKEMAKILKEVLGDCDFERRFCQLCDWKTQTGALRCMMIETFKVYE